MTRVGVQPEGPDWVEEAAALADRLRLPLVHGPGAGYSHILRVGPRGLGLWPAHDATGALVVDFLSGPTGYRLSRGPGTRQPLARALGIGKGRRPVIVDATAGLGRDALVPALLGCRVTLIERSPIVATLLEDGLRRAATSPDLGHAIARLRLLQGNACTLLPQMACAGERPDVVYLDPMFPARTKSALVKKEMRILKDIVGPDPDAGELLRCALDTALRRVAVKRPRLAPCLGNAAPDVTVGGRSMRFDVYLTGG